MNTPTTRLSGPAAGVASLIAALSAAASGTASPEGIAIQPAADGYHYRPINTNTVIRVPQGPLLGDPVVDFYEPRTDLGRRLVELRRAYILGGGRLLSWEEIDAEMRGRRGGLPDA